MSGIELQDVWKSYPRWQAGHRTLRGLAARRLASIARRGERRWALRDVSLEIQRGESLGVIGQNGAGKSTLLRLTAGVGRPTLGRIRVPQSTASVLNLGDLFDPELTGSENARTIAMVSGLRKAQAKAVVPAAIAFAEVEDFADAPVRTYSDGMKLRLAFGVVAQLRPEVLLLDEVMAVGDLRFQKKCLERIQELRAHGTTLLFASHDLDQIVEECDRAIWLQGGSVRAAGDAAEVVGAYRAAMTTTTMELTPASPATDDGSSLELRRNRFGSQEVTIDEVRVSGADGAEAAELRAGDPLVVTLVIRSHRGPVRGAAAAVSISRTSDGVVCCDSNTETDGVSLGRLESETTVVLRYDRLDLLPGHYLIEVGIYAPDWEFAYDLHTQAYDLHVTGRREAHGVYRPPHRWRVE
jgi:lipopolysaccharide transport system ATP-binding protein